MGLAGRSLLDLFLFAAFAMLFLGPVYLFAAYRVRQARSHGDERVYVVRDDPWLPAVVALTGASLIGILYLVR